EDAARRLFGGESVLDKQVHVGGRPVQVIGLYQKAGNIFEPPGQATGAIVPYLMLDQQFTVDKTNAVYISVKPRKGVTTEAAQEAATVAMRETRKLRPAEKNSFDMITQDQILDTFNKITGVFFLVMIVLSSVGLMVGGIGVMAIMMVSVTNRTREIGVRKAVGATRREIMLQFLVESATLTGIGGVIGILVGIGVGRLATAFMNIDAGIPVALTLVAVTVSVGIGIIFGIVPARRAAKMDPIEALRYE
ncbi:MAG TPA: FtsX-like permease family protein, partial [Gemmatimonadaceae bacterium]|nr:FtsX-like permease family protein [Gemmatimonadaceae bacterium]